LCKFGEILLAGSLFSGWGSVGSGGEEYYVSANVMT